MAQKTKGQLEAKISELLMRFENEYMGRYPTEANTYILKDIIFVRLKGVLTPAEKELAKNPDGADLIKRTRMQLLENTRVLLEKIIFDITGVEVKSLHSDISTKTGERVIVFSLDRNLEDLNK